MEQIALGTTGRQTTRLGFGCASIMGATNRRDSLKLLETAYDAGIRHFDVAPMYGYGEAESCLGEFLQRHPGQITITTKYGIPPPKKSSLITLGRRIAGPIVKNLPASNNVSLRQPTPPPATQSAPPSPPPRPKPPSNAASPPSAPTTSTSGSSTRPPPPTSRTTRSWPSSKTK